MIEYLIYHGPFSSSPNDPGLVAFKANGLTITLRGNRKDLNEWSKIIEGSSVLKASVQNNKVNLRMFVNANKYSTWTYFTDKEFDQFSKVYNDVKGSTVIVKIDPTPKQK